MPNIHAHALRDTYLATSLSGRPRASRSEIAWRRPRRHLGEVRLAGLGAVRRIRQRLKDQRWPSDPRRLIAARCGAELMPSDQGAAQRVVLARLAHGGIEADGETTRLAPNLLSLRRHRLIGSAGSFHDRAERLESTGLAKSLLAPKA
jgi:hypothetical protein